MHTSSALIEDAHLFISPSIAYVPLLCFVLQPADSSAFFISLLGIQCDAYSAKGLRNTAFQQSLSVKCHDIYNDIISKVINALF